MKVEVKSKKVIPGLGKVIEGVWDSMNFDMWTWHSKQAAKWDMRSVKGLIDEEDQLFYVLGDGVKVPALEIMSTMPTSYGDMGVDCYPCELISHGRYLIVDSFIKNGKIETLALDTNSMAIRLKSDIAGFINSSAKLWARYNNR